MQSKAGLISATADPGVRGLRKSHARLLTVGQTARILGISPSTLRLWENIGLVTPARSNGGFRLYNQELLEVLKRIKHLREVERLRPPGMRQVLGETVPVRTTSERQARTDLGRKLRKLRKQQDLTLKEAARRARISTGFLSAVELSRANASIATLQRVAAAYDTTVLELFDLPRQSNRVVHPHKRRTRQTKSGVVTELLATGTKMLESFLFRVPPGAGSDGAYSHEGEEFIYVVQGTLEIWLDEVECYVLQAGDSFWFESHRGHRWFNPSKEEPETVIIWVNTPPTF